MPWNCAKCGKQIEDTFDSCWNCSTPRKTGNSQSEEPPAAGQDSAPRWRLHYEMFRGTWASWDELFRQAAEFANKLGPERVVSISHSEDKDDGVVAVWYWTDEV